MDWKSLLYSHFRTRPQPLTVYDRTMVPAATVWTAKRLWVDQFRAIGLKPGDRIGISGPPRPAFLAALLAGLWEGLTVALIPPAPEHDRADLDCRLLLGPDDGDAAGAPAHDLSATLVDAVHPPTPAARLLLRTFGSTGRPKWVALSDENILSVVASHLPALYPHATLGRPDDEAARNGPVVLSVLPWFHSFGLIVDLFTALFAGTTLIRDPQHGRDAAGVLKLARQYDVTHLSMVPLLATRLAALEGGLEFLHGLHGGVIGGAPISSDLADLLRGSRLRVGYGQTEASPGICLGTPGDFTAGGIGSPVGCDVRVDDEGHFLFRGLNACLGTFQNGELNTFPPGRWSDTRDLVDVDPRHTSTGVPRYVFVGRADHDFKLSNGRLVRAARIEADLREAMPDVQSAVVVRTGDDALGVVLGSGEPSLVVDRAALARCLGPMMSRVEHLIVAPLADLPRTAKGEVDRATIASHLTHAGVRMSLDSSDETHDHDDSFSTPDLSRHRIAWRVRHAAFALGRVA